MGAVSEMQMRERPLAVQSPHCRIAIRAFQQAEELQLPVLQRPLPVHQRPFDVFGQGSGGPIFQSPVLADPSAFAVAEHRLLREIDRHPETSAALLELRELYRAHGETERVSAVG